MYTTRSQLGLESPRFDSVTPLCSNVISIQAAEESGGSTAGQQAAPCGGATAAPAPATPGPATATPAPATPGPATTQVLVVTPASQDTPASFHRSCCVFVLVCMLLLLSTWFLDHWFKFMIPLLLLISFDAATFNSLALI